MTTDELWLELERFNAQEEDDLRSSRRPAGRDLIVEVQSRRPPAAQVKLAAFWLASLWRFLEDNHHSHQAFEGLAFQALALKLSSPEFAARYKEIQKRLTLAPSEQIELKEAYLVLHGRLTSFVGLTLDNEPWAVFFQAGVFTEAGSIYHDV